MLDNSAEGPLLRILQACSRMHGRWVSNVFEIEKSRYSTLNMCSYANKHLLAAGYPEYNIFCYFDGRWLTSRSLTGSCEIRSHYPWAASRLVAAGYDLDSDTVSLSNNGILTLSWHLITYRSGIYCKYTTASAVPGTQSSASKQDQVSNS